MENYDFMSRSLMTYLTLSSLERNSSCSGYSLIKIIKEKTNNSINLKVGTIYALLEVLTEQNSLYREEQVIRKTSKEGYKRKTVYNLTNRGREELKILRQNWKTFVEEIERFEEE